MANEPSFKIRFEDLALADAGGKAARLREMLLDSGEKVDVALEKDDPSTQDMGATIILVLGTPAILKIASGIAAFLQREHASIVIEENGRVIAKGLRGQDAAKIAEAFSRRS